MLKKWGILFLLIITAGIMTMAGVDQKGVLKNGQKYEIKDNTLYLLQSGKLEIAKPGIYILRSGRRMRVGKSGRLMREGRQGQNMQKKTPVKTKGQDVKEKQKKPLTLTARPDLQVDRLEFSGYQVKVYIKNTGPADAPGPNIMARITMKYGRKWSEHQSIINRDGQPGDIVPTKKPSDRAYVVFDSTGKGNSKLEKMDFIILVDSTNKVKELNESNNKYVNSYLGTSAMDK